MTMTKNKHLILFAGAFALVACAESPEPTSQPATSPQSAPAVEQGTSNDSAAGMVVNEPVQISIDAPAGRYQLDPNHASLDFSVKHLGVSNYVMRFTDFDVTLDLDTEDLSASSVSVVVDPASIRTDFSGDYKGTHPDSSFASWDEDLALSGNFLNAGEYPEITFTSTRVAPGDDGTIQITGDLEMLGTTRPVTLAATLVGAEQTHPMMGVGFIGFSATGTFNRSDFGMTHLVNPPLVGDAVTLRFEGELLQAQDDDES